MSYASKAFYLSKDNIDFIKSQVEQSDRKRFNPSVWLDEHLDQVRLKAKPKVKKEVAVKKESFDFKRTLLELGVTNEIAETWLKIRKAKKATNSEIALKGICKEVKKAGITLNDALIMSCENSWSGFKASWVSKATGNSQFSSITQQNIDNLEDWI
ncbi:phage replication protein [uncultured Mediterranean phage uvMED]|nr:phage replication protein [uncultured Mediterranean phage uvMED]